MQIQLKERPVMDLNSGIIETYEVVKKSLEPVDTKLKI